MRLIACATPYLVKEANNLKDSEIVEAAAFTGDYTFLAIIPLSPTAGTNLTVTSTFL
ncbi:MAG: hypothetical protein STSR0001_03080 [Methanothrix sp.]